MCRRCSWCGAPLVCSFPVGFITAVALPAFAACGCAVVIVDQAHVLAMQNWDHVLDAIQGLNKMPAKVSEWMGG
mgnify:CR=1 FL=1